jgi:phage-related protein
MVYSIFIKKTRLITNKEKAEKLYKAHHIKTLLDLGAGSNPHNQIRQALGIKQILVDISNESDINSVISIDVMNFTAISKNLMILTRKDKVDCVVALHVVEHLEKDQSLKLIHQMSNWASKIIIIETPNGFLKQEGTVNNPYQAHLCGYTVNELRSLGFKVTGTTGMKFLRNNHSKGSYRIKLIPIYILDRMLFKIFHRFPKLSFNLFAYKILT